MKFLPLLLLFASCTSATGSQSSLAADDATPVTADTASTGADDAGAPEPSDVASAPEPDAGPTSDDASAPDTSAPDTTEPTDGVPPVDLAPPESGFQVSSVGRFIQPGEDVEFCEVVQLPGGPDDIYQVGRFEIGMHQWSHHIIVTAARPGSQAESNMAPGMVKPCTRAGQAYGEGLVDVFGAQQPYRELTFPDGVGRTFRGGQLLVFDYHYFNPTTEPIPARHALNFHLVEDVEHEALDFGFYNYTIFTAPGATSKYAGRCAFDRDVMVWMLVRHTHKWGTNFHVWKDGGDKDGEHLWTSTDWELDVDHILPEPMLVKKGDGFRFQCEYNNTTDSFLKFGTKATDEMCILFGVYWTADGSPADGHECVVDFAAPVDME
jgi:hypothetical protein